MQKNISTNRDDIYMNDNILDINENGVCKEQDLT